VSPIWIIIVAGIAGYLYGILAPPSSPEGDTLAGKPDHKTNEAPSGAVGGAGL
jgi:hypothetical protein